MDELNRLADILEVCAQKLEVLSAQVQVDELFVDLRTHPDLAYLDAQFSGFYEL